MESFTTSEVLLASMSLLHMVGGTRDHRQLLNSDDDDIDYEWGHFKCYFMLAVIGQAVDCSSKEVAGNEVPYIPEILKRALKSYVWSVKVRIKQKSK